MTPPICPHCGAAVPPDARSCPECGADEETGWSEEAYSANLDLPDEHFNYDEFVEREFHPPKLRPSGLHPLWWITALLLIAALIWLWLR